MHPYPLPQISNLVDATSEYQRLSFLNAFLGYNQIPLYKPNKKYTTFITNNGLNCYKVILFNPKNLRATY